MKKIAGYADEREEMRSLLWLLLVLCMAVRAGGQDDADRAAASKILALERLLKLQAPQMKALNALNDILDDQFVCVDERGTILTKSQLFVLLQTSDSATYSTDQIVVQVHGDTAVVTGLYQSKGVTSRQAFSRRVRFIDTWIRRKGAWLAIASLFTPAT